MEQDEHRPFSGHRLTQGSLARTASLVAALALLLVALIWAAVIVQSRFERQEAIAAAIRANDNRVAAFEQYVIRTLENAESALVELLSYSEGSGTAANPQRIRAPSLRAEGLAAVSVVDERGYLIASSDGPFRPNFNVANREAFTAHAAGDSDEAYVSVPAYSKIVGRHVINITRRVTRADGSFGGVVAVAIYPERLIDFYEGATVSPDDLMSVIGEDGITRARRRGDQVSYGEDVNGLQVMAFHKRHPNGTYLGPGGLDGIWRYFSHRTLDDYPLFVTVGVARDDILAPVNRRQAYYLVGAGILTFVIVAFAILLIFHLRRRQKAAAEVTDALDRLREAQRIACIGDWEYDVESGAITWSDQLYAMYGRDPRQGAPTLAEVLAYFDDAGRAVAERATDKAIETGEEQQFDQRSRSPSGDLVHHEIVIIPTLDANGKVVRLNGTDQDISERKELEILQERVAHLSRIDAMNTMAATLAHELNQPLAAASNYLAGTKRLAEQSKKAPPLLLDGLEAAQKQLLLVGKIIRRTRDMISNRTVHEPALLPDIVGDALSLLSLGSTYPKVRVRVDFGTGAEWVSADMVQVQQVLVNLVRNACEAMEEKADPEIQIATERSEPAQVRICVTDNGDGIPESVGDLFSTFSTTKQEGLGIGLSISRTIVEAHGGRIWVESTGPEGTTICFTLPAATEANI